MEKARYIVHYALEVEQNLKKIPRNMRDLIRRAIEERLTVAPLEYGKPLTKILHAYRRIRVGDYRVVYKVFEDKVVVFIVNIDRRKDVYK